MTVYSIGTKHLHKTWFLLPDGMIDEIDMVDWDITSATRLANQLGARFFWRRLSQNREDLSWNWGCYRTNPLDDVVSWKGQKIEPFKVVRSPDSSSVEMLCRTLGAVR